MTSLTLLLNMSSFLARIEEEDIFEMWPDRFRWSPTALVDAFVIATCSLNLTPKGLAKKWSLALTLNFVHHPSFSFVVCRIFGVGQVLPDGLERLVECANSLFLKTFVSQFSETPCRYREVRNCEHEWRRLHFLYLRCWLSLAGCLISTVDRPWWSSRLEEREFSPPIVCISDSNWD